MPRTSQYAKRASRALKRIQREPIAIAVRNALETEIWFRSNADPGGVRFATQAILEEVLLEVMYDLPSRTDVVKCVVDRDTVLRHVAPTLITEDESRRSA
jgi:ATP-dependent Clp protease ATP-binding subunit ClpX